MLTVFTSRLTTNISILQLEYLFSNDFLKAGILILSPILNFDLIMIKIFVYMF